MNCPGRSTGDRRKFGGDFSLDDGHQLVDRTLLGDCEQLVTLRVGQRTRECQCHAQPIHPPTFFAVVAR